MSEDYLPDLGIGIDHELDPYWLDPSLNYPEPHYLLEYKGVGFSPIGGIQAISGQKKNGKTFVLAQLMAAILGKDSERAKAKLPGLKVREDTLEWIGHKPVVLYVDTEMEQLNSAKVLRRVHWLCGWPQDEKNDQFHVLWLRQVQDVVNDEGKVVMAAHKRRLDLIVRAIEQVHPTAVFIDGIRDIIGDFNDNEQSSSLVTQLMSLASSNNMCIWNVLHMNPRPGNDDESKMRGHLGTELGNKVSDTFVSVKKKTAAGVVFTVKQQDARGKDIEDWSFEITDDAGNLGIPRFTDAPPEEPKRKSSVPAEPTMDDWKKVCKILRDAIEPPKSASYTTVREALKKGMGIGSGKAEQWMKKATDVELLEYMKNFNKYRYNTEKEDELTNDDPFA